MSANIVMTIAAVPTVGSVETTAATLVTLSNQTDTGVFGWEWTLLDKPTGSSSTVVNPNNPSATITPDIPGTYLIRLKTFTDVGRTVLDAADVEAVGVRYTESLLWRVPAAGETTQFDPTKGWAGEMNTILDAVRTEVLEAGGGLKTFIYDPTATPTKNIYTSWALLGAAVEAAGPNIPKVVHIASLGAGTGTIVDTITHTQAYNFKNTILRGNASLRRDDQRMVFDGATSVWSTPPTLIENLLLELDSEGDNSFFANTTAGLDIAVRLVNTTFEMQGGGTSAVFRNTLASAAVRLYLEGDSAFVGNANGAFARSTVSGAVVDVYLEGAGCSLGTNWARTDASNPADIRLYHQGESTIAALTQTGIRQAQITQRNLQVLGFTAVGAQNDYTPSSPVASVLRWNGASPLTLTGLVPSPSRSVRWLVNATTTFSLDITGESGSSAAANRFAENERLLPGMSALVWYDETAARNRLLVLPGSSVLGVRLGATVTPSPAAGVGRVYTRTFSGQTELFYQDAAGNEVQLTDAGVVFLSVPYAAEAALSASNDSATFVNVGAVYLPEGELDTNSRFLMGSLLAGDTAEVELRRETGATLLATWTQAGALQNTVLGSTPMVIADWYNIRLRAQTAADTALIKGYQISVVPSSV